MRPTSRTPLLLAALALLASPPAARAADEQGPPGGRVRAELSLGAFHLDYAEYAPDGTFLDGELGWLPSVAGAVEIAGRRGFFRGAGRLASGVVDYDGHVQTTDPALAPLVNGLPVQSESGALFALVEAQVGGFLEPARRLAVFGGLAARRWDRDIRSTRVVPRGGGAPIPVEGLSEVYTWYELQAGLRWTVLRAGRAELDLEGAVVRTTWGTMKVDFGRRVTLDLGDRTGLRGGGTFRWALRGGNLHLLLGGRVESYGFGQSPVVLVDPADPNTGILEPRSDTVAISVDAGLGARF